MNVQDKENVKMGQHNTNVQHGQGQVGSGLNKPGMQQQQFASGPVKSGDTHKINDSRLKPDEEKTTGEYIQDKTQENWEATKEGAAKAWENTKEAFQEAGENIKEGAQKAYDYVAGNDKTTDKSGVQQSNLQGSGFQGQQGISGQSNLSGQQSHLQSGSGFQDRGMGMGQSGISGQSNLSGQKGIGQSNLGQSNLSGQQGIGGGSNLSGQQGLGQQRSGMSGGQGVQSSQLNGQGFQQSQPLGGRKDI